MKHFAFFAFLTFCLNAAVFGQNSPVPVAKSGNAESLTQFETGLFSLSFPSNWTLDTSGQMGTKFIILSPGQTEPTGFQANINLLVQDLKGYNVDMDMFVEITEQQVKTLIENGNIVESKRLSDSPIPQHKFIYAGKMQDWVLKFEQYVWIKDENAYILSFTTKLDDFEKYQATGEQILNSFKIKG